MLLFFFYFSIFILFFHQFNIHGFNQHKYPIEQNHILHSSLLLLTLSSNYNILNIHIHNKSLHKHVGKEKGDGLWWLWRRRLYKPLAMVCCDCEGDARNSFRWCCNKKKHFIVKEIKGRNFSFLHSICTTYSPIKLFGQEIYHSFY